MRRQPRTSANRAALTATGLVLMLGGFWPATARGPLAERLPGWWPLPADRSVLLDRAESAVLRDHSWWTPTVVAVGVVMTALLVLSSLAQLHIRKPSRLPLEGAGSVLRTHALERALSERAAAHDGIARCRIRVRLSRGRLQLRMRVWLAPGTAPARVLDALAAVTAEAEHAVSPYVIEARVRLSHRPHSAPHVH
ncbi:Asp23/Gls24 family envelope stress response protein [Streptomyces luteolus]|uniref:Alkaline shock response membrane anchor protein AmaP n=1 Tax=Streptomyces luteolus TaxID=3043615 RepID=A0ABT6SWL5_9ACTN|nr:hypothetical protein [Streptomyces sp. B-S-A12]MDI3419052.1 hypothetical protein [Streptomyces sp. B-S-A12]